MQEIWALLSEEIMFWAVWVIIPIIVEIIPAIFGFVVLIKKFFLQKKSKKFETFKPQISLIIPVYNCEKTLAACLDSVYNSTYPRESISVLLANNGSKDKSFEVFQQYQQAHHDLSMKWFNSQQGKSKALNMALYNSTGKYIIHIDSDGVLEKSAISNLIMRFEADDKIECMTGSVLTNPELIEEIKKPYGKLIAKLEFVEYAQAFLAGRNFEAEIDNIFTLSGAFSAFKKSTILKTQLYNSETVCEDTHITFQVRHLLKKSVHICETAFFFVEPAEELKHLYVQRQRWQRGEIEVAHMFHNRQLESSDNNKKAKKNFSLIYLLLFDHTFAFPRMIWYFALLFLAFFEYPFNLVAISMIAIMVLYTLSTFLYFLNVCSFLTPFKALKSYYVNKWYLIFLMPIYNFILFWFRFAGIVNSIKNSSSWRTATIHQELSKFKRIVISDMALIKSLFNKVRKE